MMLPESPDKYDLPRRALFYIEIVTLYGDAAAGVSRSDLPAVIGQYDFELGGEEVGSGGFSPGISRHIPE